MRSFFKYSTLFLTAGKRHSSDFSRLIAQVRGHLETTRQTRIKQEDIVEGDDAQKTKAAGTAILLTLSRNKMYFSNRRLKGI